MTNGNDSIFNSEQGPQDGLSKREYFAGLAMQGILASFSLQDNIASPGTTAQTAVNMADALIKELNK